MKSISVLLQVTLFESFFALVQSNKCPRHLDLQPLLVCIVNRLFSAAFLLPLFADFTFTLDRSLRRLTGVIHKLTAGFGAITSSPRPRNAVGEINVPSVPPDLCGQREKSTAEGLGCESSYSTLSSNTFPGQVTRCTLTRCRLSARMLEQSPEVLGGASTRMQHREPFSPQRQQRHA